MEAGVASGTNFDEMVVCFWYAVRAGGVDEIWKVFPRAVANMMAVREGREVPVPLGRVAVMIPGKPGVIARVKEKHVDLGTNWLPGKGAR